MQTLYCMFYLGCQIPASFSDISQFYKQKKVLSVCVCSAIVVLFALIFALIFALPSVHGGAKLTYIYIYLHSCTQVYKDIYINACIQPYNFNFMTSWNNKKKEYQALVLSYDLGPTQPPAPLYIVSEHVSILQYREKKRGGGAFVALY
jgi:hypothetical protein